MRKGSLWAACAALACIVGSFGPVHADPVKLRVAWASAPAQLTPIVFAKKDLLKHDGKSYTVEMIRIPGSSLQITGLGSGDLDIAALSYSAYATAILNGRLPIKAFLDVYQDGPTFSTTYGVRSDSPIKTVEDLKGKIFGVPAFGGAIDVAARAMLLQKGLKPEQDVPMLEVQFGAEEAMLRSSKVDIAGFTADVWAIAAKKGDMRPIFRMKESMGDSQMIFMVARGDFMQKNRAALVDFAEDYIRGVRWFLDPANRAEALRLLAEFTKRPQDAYADWALIEKTDYFRDPSGTLNVKALQRNVDDLEKLKITKSKLDIGSHVDTAIAGEAASRLK